LNGGFCQTSFSGAPKRTGKNLEQASLKISHEAVEVRARQSVSVGGRCFEIFKWISVGREEMVSGLVVVEVAGVNVSSVFCGW
jgi:hypothetical protein